MLESSILTFSVTEVKELEFGIYHFHTPESQNWQIQADYVAERFYSIVTVGKYICDVYSAIFFNYTCLIYGNVNDLFFLHELSVRQHGWHSS